MRAVYVSVPLQHKADVLAIAKKLGLTAVTELEGPVPLAVLFADPQGSFEATMKMIKQFGGTPRCRTIILAEMRGVNRVTLDAFTQYVCVDQNLIPWKEELQNKLLVLTSLMEECA